MRASFKESKKRFKAAYKEYQSDTNVENDKVIHVDFKQKARRTTPTKETAAKMATKQRKVGLLRRLI